jgi:glycosyltransferase involved in cell wall biosynthesis
MDTVAIVVPVYGNEFNIANLIKRIEALKQNFGKNVELQAVFVCDGEIDNSPSLLFDYQKNDFDFDFHIINLSKNFGAFNAIKCGIDNVDADIVLVMSADLQEPIQLYIDILHEIRSNKSEIVFGVRFKREDTSIFSKIYWNAYRNIVLNEIPHGGVDVFAITRKVVSVLKNMELRNSSLIGILFQIGFKKTFVEYHRAKRDRGVSKWTFRKKIKYVGDSFYSFSRLPIIFMHLLGIIGVVFSATYGLLLLGLRIRNSIQVPGYTALMIIFLFLGSLIILSLGILGSYIWRIYENSKNLPPYLITTHTSKNNTKNLD